jgi:hypothetical protein
MNLEFFRQLFEKCSNIKFRENPSPESRVVSCEQRERERDMMKPLVAFRNFVNSPKMIRIYKLFKFIIHSHVVI